MKTEIKTEKVKLLYQAVEELLGEGADLSALKVSDITKRAGIGKATAYDYFSTKDELIIKSLLYFSECTVKRLIDMMEKEETFQDKVFVLLNQMERQNQRRCCVMKYMNIINKKDMWQEIKDKYIGNCKESKANPILLIRYLIDDGKKTGVINKNLPQSYLEITITAKLISFMIFIDQQKEIHDCDSGKMKQLLYDGLVKELS